MAGRPLPVALYRIAADLIAPLAYRRVARKLAAQGTPATRLKERQGRATAPRPAGRLVWVHAASVGESVSVLRLIETIGARQPDMSFLLTSGTASSARVLAGRLPPRTRHQFAPLDSRPAVRRFLAHWKPDAGIFVESELWPQLLSAADAAGVPLALVNARLSEGTARTWKRFPQSARHVLAPFRFIHCQDKRTAAHLHDLGLSHAETGANLKSLAAPLPVDAREHDRLAGRIGDRPLWLASSTHPGEDEGIIAAHRAVLARHPGVLLILVPRHPERASAIAALIRRAGLIAARRSAGEEITEKCQIFLADTLGETGLWYALSPLTCLCGSFTPVGGHNPFEPAQAGSAILHGPLHANFAAPYRTLDEAGAARQVAGPEELAEAVLALLEDGAALARMRRAARAQASQHAGALDDLAERLCATLLAARDNRARPNPRQDPCRS